MRWRGPVCWLAPEGGPVFGRRRCRVHRMTWLVLLALAAVAGALQTAGVQTSHQRGGSAYTPRALWEVVLGWVTPGPTYVTLGDARHAVSWEHGWPLTYLWRETTYRDSEVPGPGGPWAVHRGVRLVSVPALAVDLAATTGLLGIFALLLERRLRRAGPD